MKLVFGVVDVPYENSYAPRGRRSPAPGSKLPAKTAGPRSGVTTGDVAEFLEHRYHVCEKFFELHEDEVVAAITEAMEDKLEVLMLGGPSSDVLLSEGDLGKVEQMFRKMLDDRELDNKVAGVPTQAARAGVNHRLAHPYASTNPERPSFIDVGLYQSMFRAWIEE